MLKPKDELKINNTKRVHHTINKSTQQNLVVKRLLAKQFVVFKWFILDKNLLDHNEKNDEFFWRKKMEIL